MKNKVAITVESACDLSHETAAEKGIRIIPMNISLGEEEFKDGIDIDAKRLFEKCELKKIQPKTAGISPYEYEKVFSSLTGAGYEVVHVALGSGISSCFRNALFAAKNVGGVFVVDSLSLSGGLALLAKKAAALRDEGFCAKEIAKEIEKERKKVSVSFVLEDIAALYKGGRCSALELFSANLFSIHPSIELCGGKLVPGVRYKGKIETARKKYIKDKIAASKIAKNSPCLLNHSGLCGEEISDLVSYIKQLYPFCEVLPGRAGCCISTHCGKGCMGIIFETESR